MGGVGRTLTTFSTNRFYWSTTNANGKLQDYVPTPFAQADYLINFAILKGHSAGITLCGKNLYGALKRCPSGSLYGQGTLNYYVTHLSLPNAEWSPGLGHYRSIVDLMGSKNLGARPCCIWSMDCSAGIGGIRIPIPGKCRHLETAPMPIGPPACWCRKTR